MYKTKMVRAETRLLGDEGSDVLAIVSTEDVDRDGDVIRASGWHLDNFMRHPVLLSSHDYGSLRSQIGEWTSMDVRNGKLVGTARYYTNAGNKEADWGFELAKRGRAAFSVGFAPDMTKARSVPTGAGAPPSFEYNGQELLEVSQVTVPANPQSLQQIKSLGLHPVIESVVDDVLTDASIPSNTSASAEELVSKINDLSQQLDVRLAELEIDALAQAHIGKTIVSAITKAFRSKSQWKT